MKYQTRLLAAAGLTAALALPTLAHIEKTEPLQSLRQSYWALVGMSFGPIGDMAKGKIPWDGAKMARWTSDLAAVSSYEVERGFAPGSERGKTRAKPEIWDDWADFEEHLEEFRAEALKLSQVAAAGDEVAIKQQVGSTGKTCKSCHDEFKSKDYLYD